MPAIAIVEDEFIVALDIKSFLEKCGYAVTGVYSSGEDLLAALVGAKPDLVLMDIKISGRFDGVETARIVNEQHRIPVILLTAYADDETIQRAKITEPFGYIIKPFEERELKTSIEIALYRAGMERKLRESEARFRRLFAEGSSGNFLADAGGKLLDANKAFRHLFKIGESEELPRLRDLFSDTRSWEAFWERIGTAGRIELHEIELRDLGGKRLSAMVSAVRLVDSSGSVEGIQGEIVDVTEKKRLEERLLQAQKMEAIGNLAGGIAHDFNNVLTAILGYASLLMDELPEIGKSREDVEGIKKAASRATNLTRQLLAFSRRQAFSPRVVDINILMADTERMLRRLLTEGISLSLSLDARKPMVHADPIQIEQVVLNLVVNARDAMPRGGRVRICTRNESLESEWDIGLDALPAGEYVILEVADTGSGIDPSIKDKIFEPFFTTKPKDQGTGLGLSTVYGIAKQSGGAVGLNSTLGLGSCFAVWLPVSAEGTTLEEGESEAAETAKEGSATILFVDDDESLRNLASRILAKRGYRVLVAANAGEAILLAEERKEPLDLVILDAILPIMDGISLAKRLEDLMPGIRVLFISGFPAVSADPEVRGQFLPKPFGEAELLAAVSREIAKDVPPTRKPSTRRGR